MASRLVSSKPKAKRRYASGGRTEAKRKLAERVRALTMVEGLSAQATADRLGISRRYVFELKLMAPDLGVGGVVYLPDAKPLSSITDPEILACLEDTPDGFERFFNRYSGLILQPHSRMFTRAAFDYPGQCGRCQEPAPYRLGAELLCDGCAHGPDLFLLPGMVLIGRWKERVLINVPPGFAKTHIFSIWRSIWRLAADRSRRIILLSETADVAVEIAGEIAQELEENEKLNSDFGRFRSESGTVKWQPGKGNLRLEGSKLTRGFNLRSRGAQQQVQGLRADELIVDDLCSPENQATGDRREKLSDWFNNVVLSRLEPGAPATVIGTRQHLLDLYGELADKTVIDGDPESPRLWEHINFPAVFDPVTGTPSIDFENGVSLWPTKWSLPTLAKRYATIGSSAFQKSYQQQPIPPDEQLVRPEWILGPDHDEDPRRGCLDRDRIAGRQPRREGHLRLISFDPTITRYAGLIVGDLNTADRSNFNFVVVEIVRKRLDIRGSIAELDRLCSTYAPSHVLLEENIGWHFLSNPEFLALQKARSFRLVKHRTQGNKTDPVLGVQSLAVDFEFGRIRLPFGDAESMRQTTLLKTEACEYPYGATDDLLMALWFAKANYRTLSRPRPALQQSTGRWPEPLLVPGSAWGSGGWWLG